MGEFSFGPDDWECFERIDIAVTQRALTELSQLLRRFPIEISLRGFGVTLALAGEEGGDVPTILAQQGMGFVFGMTLHIDKQAFLVPDEHIGAAIGQLRQDLIPLRTKLVLAQAVVTGMRYA